MSVSLANVEENNFMIALFNAFQYLIGNVKKANSLIKMNACIDEARLFVHFPLSNRL